MADLPDYYTQTAITEAEAASITGGLDANKPDDCEEKDVYLATDTHILYVCFANGTWTGFDASILTQGILTLYANMVAGGYRITGLGAPTAQDDALRYNRAEIRNAEIAAAAAIAYSKLTLTGSLLMADLATAIKNAAAGLVVLDASADVPLAQIPDTLTGKDADTLDGSHLASLFRTIGGDLSGEAEATGDCANPERLNDGVLDAPAQGDNINEYTQILFGDVVRLNQFRVAKVASGGSNDDGEISVQYLNPETHTWTNWVTGKVIPMDATEYMNWDSSGGTILCSGIKIIFTKLDTGVAYTRVCELEVKYA